MTDRNDLSTGVLNNVFAHNRLGTPISPFDQDVRLKPTNQGKRRVFLKCGDIVHDCKGGKQRQTAGLIQNRALVSFQPFDRGIGVQANHKDIAKRLCLSQHINMTAMYQVETAVRKNDALPLTAESSQPFCQLFFGKNLLHSGRRLVSERTLSG